MKPWDRFFDILKPPEQMVSIFGDDIHDKIFLTYCYQDVWNRTTLLTRHFSLTKAIKYMVLLIQIEVEILITENLLQVLLLNMPVALYFTKPNSRRLLH